MQQLPLMLTADPIRGLPGDRTDGLILLGLEGIVEYMRRIRMAIERRDAAAKKSAMERAQQIVQHLLVNLDEDLPTEQLLRLDSLYRYLLLKLAHANLFNEAQAILACRPIVDDLRGLWMVILSSSSEHSGSFSGQVDFERMLVG